MIKIERAKLYDRLWTKGLVKTASELNTTSEKLKAVSLQADIPLPTPRYWTMRQRANPIPRSPLPESDLTLLEVPQKQVRQAKASPKPIPSATSKNISPKSNYDVGYPAIFEEIQLANRAAIISAYQQLKVPSRLPNHLHPLINQLHHAEKSEPVHFSGYSRPAPVLWFHGRYEKAVPKGALIIANTLLETLTLIGAAVTLNNNDNNYRGRYDAEFELEGAEFELSCYVPTQKDEISKNKWEWATFSPTNEPIRFAVNTTYTWSKSQISHKSKEVETDYVRRVFTRIISLIPKGRMEAADREERQKQADHDAKIEAEQRQRHDTEYQNVEALLRKIQLHEFTEKIRHHTMANETSADTKWRTEIADWLEFGNSEGLILTESDCNNLLAHFAHSQLPESRTI